MMHEPFDLCSAPLDGATLIEASAGTGKTYTLTGLFLRLLIEKRLPIDQILVVTFTTAATEELRGRIRHRLTTMIATLDGETEPEDALEACLWRKFRHTDAQDVLRAAVRAFDLSQIFTIHSFCQRMLSKNGFECQALFETTLEPDLSDLQRQACLDFWRVRVATVDGLVGAAVRRQLTPDMLQALASLPMLAQVTRIEPERPTPDTAVRERTVVNFLDHVRVLWIREREAVLALMCTHQGLKANMSKPAQLARRFEALEQFLGRPGLELPKEVKELTPAYMVKMTKKGSTPPSHPLFVLVGQMIEAMEALQTGIMELITHLRQVFLTGWEAEMDRRKAQRNVQSFDDLLRLMHRAVTGPGAEHLVATVRAQYRAALIDEFQDTDALQYTIFTHLFAEDSQALYLIGDPKQAIYSFRGADIHTYLRAAEVCARTATLGTNYRSTPELIEAVNQLFSTVAQPFLHPGISYQAVGWPDKESDRYNEDGKCFPPLTIWQPRAQADKPLARGWVIPRVCQAVTAEISRMLRGAQEGRICIGQRPLRAKDIAILVETHRQGELVHLSLRVQNIHSVLIHSSSVLASVEARDVLAVLRAVVDYHRVALLRPALATVILGQDTRALRELEAGGVAHDLWVERMAAWHTLWERHGVMAAMRRMLADTQARARLLELSGGERRMTNVLHCLEILHVQERETQIGMRMLTAWFARQLGGVNREEFQLRLDSDRDAVQIVTVHRSKGLEYPVVFCPFLYGSARLQSDWPLAREDGLILDVGSEQIEQRRGAALREAQAELVRLAYVALTRAACRCYLVWGWINSAETSGLAWVLHGHHVEAPEALSWKTFDEVALTADLRQLAGAHIAVRDLPEELPQPVLSMFAAVPELRVSVWTRILGPLHCLSSFSGLTRGVEHVGVSGFDDQDDPGEVPSGMTMAQFPRGAVAGTCLHRVFEQVDFSAPESVCKSISKSVAQALNAFGFSLDWQSVVERMVGHVLEADLGGFCLGSVRERLVELEFLFPLRPLRGEDLAAVYRRARVSLGADMPARMERLRFEPRQGFLSGFMDLLFRHQGRYYLLDWKSNWLGPTPAHYSPDALRASMTDNYYFLQYHLYCVALDRYLRLRQPGYNSAKHFGGVRYIYLRGIDPAFPGCGVYADSPDPALLAELDRVLIPAQEAR